MILGHDYVLWEDKLVSPAIDSLNYAHEFKKYIVDIENWEKSNIVIKRIIMELSL